MTHFRTLQTRSRLVSNLDIWLGLLSGIELFIAGFVTLLIGEISESGLLGRSAARWFMGLGLMATGAVLAGFTLFIWRKDSLRKTLNIWLAKESLLWMMCAGICALGLGMIVLSPSKELTVRLAPALLSFWLIGLEIIFVAELLQKQKQDIEGVKPAGRCWLGILTIALWILTAALPSGIPGWFDGLPWDKPIEFVSLAVILPLAILVDWRVFTRRWVLYVTVFLLVLKIVLVSSAPQSGLEIRIYRSAEAAMQNQWTRGYESLLNNRMTTVMTAPYFGNRNFPIEWVNDVGLSPDSTWLELEFNGYVHLNSGEQLLLNANAAKGGWIEIVNLETSEVLRGDFSSQTGNILRTDQPAQPGVWYAHGFLIYQGGDIVFQPMISTGVNTIDAFKTNSLWRTAGGAATDPAVLKVWLLLASLLDAGLMLILLASLGVGLWAQVSTKRLSALDAYLLLSAGLLFSISRWVSQDSIPRWALVIVVLMGGIKLAQLFLLHEKRHFSNRGWLLILAASLMALFLNLDLLQLQQVTIFPQGQDSLEYQIEARNIFVGGDLLQRNNPPRAYKILFPYLVGELHVLFGQSSVAQLLLNVWAVVLTGWLVLDTLERMKITQLAGMVAALMSLVIYLNPMFYTYYFRFGLIEPLATCLLILVFNLALKRQYVAWFICGILLVLLRMDYLGGTFAAVFLCGVPWVGDWKNVFICIREFWQQEWKRLVFYGLSLVTAPIGIIMYYRMTVGYVLNASDTWQTSISTILEGVVRLINGGTWAEIVKWLTNWPLDTLLMITILYCGVAIAFLAFLRNGKGSRLDLRWTLIFLCLMSIYLFVRPTGYSPRFSTPLIALGLIVVTNGLAVWFRPQRKISY